MRFQCKSLAFTTSRNTNGWNNYIEGTAQADFGAFTNLAGTTFIGGLAGADNIILNQPDTGFLKSIVLYGNDGADVISLAGGTSIDSFEIIGNAGSDSIDFGGFLGDVASNGWVGGGLGDDDIFQAGFSPDSLVNVTVNGGAGNDEMDLDGSLAESNFLGGAGNDTLRLRNSLARSLTYQNSEINGNDNTDVIITYAGAFNPGYLSPLEALPLIKAYELDVRIGANVWISGGAGADTLDFRGAFNTAGEFSGLGFTLRGGAGEDIIYGSDQDDTILGNNGSDQIFAGFGDDVITGGAGGDRYAGIAQDDTTYVIEAVSDSAAATSGTFRSFDAFVSPASFDASEELDITAVTNTLAGGPYVGLDSASVTSLANLGAFADFGALKASIDLIPLASKAPSDTTEIRAYAFGASIAGGLNVAYGWVQDSSADFSSNDLLFEISFLGGGALPVAGTTIFAAGASPVIV